MIDSKFIKVPRLKSLVRVKLRRQPKGIIKSATISRYSSGRYYISLLCKEEIIELPEINFTTGIDSGTVDFVILSGGQKIDSNKFTSRMEKKLRCGQRKLSRRALSAENKGINLFEARNCQKQKRKIARLHEKVMSQCTDLLNKLSTEMIKSRDTICIEDLNTKGMSRNHKLAKSIPDVSRSRSVIKLQHKVDWYGRKITKADKWFSSSRICSECGHKDGKKPPEIRERTCPVCHTHHDRDTNVNINILTEGLKLHFTGLV